MIQWVHRNCAMSEHYTLHPANLENTIKKLYKLKFETIESHVSDNVPSV